MLRRVRWPQVCAALAIVLGCGHTDAFAPTDNGTTAPLAAGEPTRLTFAPTPDLTPTWLADGSGIVYAYDDDANGQRGVPDRCLGVLAPTGGRRSRELCSVSVAQVDSVDRFEEPAALPDGRLSYMRSAGPGDKVGGAYERVRVGSLQAGAPEITVPVLPYPTDDGQRRDVLTHVRWLSSTDAIAVGSARGQYFPCARCDVVPFVVGRELVRVSIGGGITPLTGLDSVTSAVPTADGSAVYFTRLGDTKVYRIAPSGGAVTVALDFGAAGIARDVQVRGTTLYAVVGGGAQVVDVMPMGRVQLDDGGDIYVADLAAGTFHPLESGTRVRLYRRLSLAPSGAALLAEGRALLVPGSLTSVGDADVWRFGEP